MRQLANTVSLKSYRTFEKEFLNDASDKLIGGESLAGESVLVTALDGVGCLFDGYLPLNDSALGEIGRKKVLLIPTERHIAAYRSRGGFSSDLAVAIRYAQLSRIEFCVIIGKRGRAVGLLEFVGAHEDMSLCFATNIIDVFTYDAIRKLLVEIRRKTGIRLVDRTSADVKEALGLVRS